MWHVNTGRCCKKKTVIKWEWVTCASPVLFGVIKFAHIRPHAITQRSISSYRIIIHADIGQCVFAGPFEQTELLYLTLHTGEKSDVLLWGVMLRRNLYSSEIILKWEIWTAASPPHQTEWVWVCLNQKHTIYMNTNRHYDLNKTFQQWVNRWFNWCSGQQFHYRFNIPVWLLQEGVYDGVTQALGDIG